MILLYFIALFQSAFIVTACAVLVYFCKRKNPQEKRRTPDYAIAWIISYGLLALRVIAVVYFKETVIDYEASPFVAYASTAITVFAFFLGDWALWLAAKDVLERAKFL